MRNCYNKYLDYYPWEESDFPTFEDWIVCDDKHVRIFRQGWAACRDTIKELERIERQERKERSQLPRNPR